MKQIISSLAPAAIALALGACASEPEAPETNTIVGTEWLAEDIEQRGVVDRVQTTLRFETDDRVAGNGGCNRYFGGMTLDGNRIGFGNLGSTMMACPEAVMDQERRFLKALERTSSFRVDLQTGLLYLSDEVGNDLLRFSPLD